ncbi:MAG: hypothetical protein ABIG61_14675, partial [Planctomycetota bacterium]
WHADNIMAAFGNTDAAPDAYIQSDGTNLQIDADTQIDFSIATADQMNLGATGLHFPDNKMVMFGNNAAAPDAYIRSDGTNLDIDADTQIDFSIATADQMNLGATGLHFPDNKRVMFGNTAAAPDAYIKSDGTDLDIDADTTIGFSIATVDVMNLVPGCLFFPDNKYLLFGNTSGAPDASIRSDGTILRIDSAHGVANIAVFGSSHATLNNIFVGFGEEADYSVCVGFNQTTDTGYMMIAGEAATAGLLIYDGGFVGAGTGMWLDDNIPIAFGNSSAVPDGKVYSDGTNLIINAGATVITFVTAGNRVDYSWDTLHEDDKDVFFGSDQDGHIYWSNENSKHFVKLTLPTDAGSVASGEWYSNGGVVTIKA